MSNADCERWVAMSDKAALGLQLSNEEDLFQVQHEASCAACRAESSAWSALSRAALDERALTHAESWRPLEPRGLGALGRNWLGQGRSQLFGTGPRKARTVAILAAAAAAAGWFFGVHTRAEERTQAAADAGVTLALVSGDVAVGSQRRGAGSTLKEGDVLQVRAGRACLHLEPGVTACLGEASQVTVTSTKLAERVLSLTSGTLLAKLAHQPRGAVFRVETARGSITAKGTMFAVEMGEDRSVGVRVHEGTVLLGGQLGAPRQLPAPAAARFDAALTTSSLSDGERERDRSLIGLSRVASVSGSGCLLDVTTTPAGARVALDDADLGPAPVSALVSEGRRLSVVQPGYAPVNERIWLTGASSLSRSYELSPLAVANANANGSQASLGAAPAAQTSGVARPSSEPSPTPSAAELLSRARGLRAAGRPADAAAAYRRLIGQYPRSDEARASLVSLGELQLSELSEPAPALRSFDAYLKSPGALTQEARYGKIRALGRLGRRADELAESRNFVRDYPRSVQANSLRARLAP